MSTPSPRARVAYISSPSLRSAADRLPSNRGRSSAVHALIESLKLLHDAQANHSHHDGEASCPPELNRARLVEAIPATKKELTRYHDRDYVSGHQSIEGIDAECLSKVEALLSEEALDDRPAKRPRINIDALDELDSQEEDEDHGLEYDCPAFRGLKEYCLEIAGGSLTAARELKEGEADIAIHWDGGRHHATKGKAAGFCYINDIVLAILELQRPSSSHLLRPDKPQKRMKTILYIDLDLHHGDGVADAFEHSDTVTTLSMHLWAPGFYPSTPQGHLTYSGLDAVSTAAPVSTLNLAVPRSGLSDGCFIRLVDSCIKPIYDAIQPDALVLQCGLDGLAGDPCKEFNISLTGYGTAVSSILSWTVHVSGERVPVLMLGGGGYNTPNVARGWAYLTSVALGRPLDLDSATVPEDCELWEQLVQKAEQGDSLDVPANVARMDSNTEEDLQEIERVFAGYARSHSR